MILQDQNYITTIINYLLTDREIIIIDFDTVKEIILKKEGVLLSLNEYAYTPFYYHLIEESEIIKKFSYQYKADETILNILEKEYKHIFTSMHAIFYKNKQKLYNFLKNDYKDFDSEEEKRAILKQLRY